MANTVSNARKNLINDAARGLVSAPFFTGTTAAPSYSFQGSNFGYVSGGNYNATVNVNNIEKFSFTSDGNGSDVGDLSVARRGVAGQSSTVSGYTSGGGTPTYSDVIDKFPFSSDGNASDVGNLTVARGLGLAGQSSSDNGYSSGGIPVVTVM